MMCERDDVKEYILSQTEIEAPEIQNRFSLTYSEMKSIIDGLVKCKAIEFISGVTYKVNPENLVEVEPYVPKNETEKLFIRILWECIRLGKTSVSPMDLRVSCEYHDIFEAQRWMEQNHFVTPLVERKVTITEEEFIKKFGEEYCNNPVGDPFRRWGFRNHRPPHHSSSDSLKSLRERLEELSKKREELNKVDGADKDDKDIDDLDDLDDLDNEDSWDDDEMEDKHDDDDDLGDFIDEFDLDKDEDSDDDDKFDKHEDDDDDLDEFLDKFNLNEDEDDDDDENWDPEKVLKPSFADVKNNARFAVIESIISEMQYQDGVEKCVLELDGEGRLEFELVNGCKSIKISDGGKTLEETKKSYRRITNALKAFAPVEFDGKEITITIDKESNVLAALLKLYSAIDTIKKLK